MRIFYFLASLIISHAVFADLTVYVNNPVGGDVTQIPLDPTTGAPSLGATTNDEGNDTHDLAASPNGEYIYVTTVAGQLEQFAINPITGAPVFVGSVFILGELGDIAISPDGKYAYIADGVNNEILQVSLAPVTGTPSLVASLPFTVPVGIEIAPDGRNAYVGDDNGTLSQIILDPTTGAPSLGGQATIVGGRIPRLTIAPNGKNVYAVVDILNEVAQFTIDASGAPTVGTVISTGLHGLTDIAIAPNGANAYLVDDPSNTVTQIIINPITGAPSLGAQTTSGGSGAQRIVVAPDGANAYVTNEISTDISQISLDPNTGVPTFVTSVMNGILPFNIIITNFTPPTGTQKRNRFLTQTDIVNILKWQAFGPAVSYSVYRDAALTNLVGTISATSPRVEFKDHNRKKGKTYEYFIVANTGFGPVFLGSITVFPNR